MKRWIGWVLLVLVFGCLAAPEPLERIPAEQMPQDEVPPDDTPDPEITEEISSIFEIELPFTDGACEKPVFTEYFVEPSYVRQMGQVGTVHGSGQFTVERSYISVKGAEKIPIYAPMDLILTRGAYYQVPAPNDEFLGEPLPDYVLYFDVGCGVEIAWGHLKEVVPEIARQFSTPKADSRTEELQPVEFKAGDLIGYFIPNAGVASFDFIAYDEDVTNQFANQERHTYGYGDTLLHAVCPYDFYTTEKKEAYYGLIGAECGPISRDYPGTISGLWFLDPEVNSWFYDYSQEGVYGSVLPIVGDVDRVIIGTIGNRRSTFIYPNEPTYRDPKEVTDAHCYQLHPEYNPSEKDGYIFFQLVDNETLKVYYSETGECLEDFPATGWETYYR